jgi:hypothetical protein
MHRAGPRNLFAVAVFTASLGGPLLAGCSSPTASRASATSQPDLLRATTGVVTGRYLMEGGPIYPKTGKTADPWPIPGQVTFSGHRTSRTVKVGSGGAFSVHLPIGVYAVSAETPRLEVSADPGTPCYLSQVVTVRAGVSTSVTVYCPVP